jgi:hypothetical protein
LPYNRVMQAKSVLLLPLLILCGCGKAPTSMPSTPTGANSKIGHVAWVIYDGPSMKEIGRGEKDVLLKDVSIESVGQGMMKKQISLSDHFRLVCAEIPKSNANDLVGFGLSPDRDDKGTFSWEWFNVDRTGHGRKIQEEGEINFQQRKTANGWEIILMEFPTDISCRMIEFNAGANPLKPQWRLNILKGSTITWPSLVNGQVVAN